MDSTHGKSEKSGEQESRLFVFIMPNGSSKRSPIRNHVLGPESVMDGIISYNLFLHLIATSYSYVPSITGSGFSSKHPHGPHAGNGRSSGSGLVVRHRTVEFNADFGDIVSLYC